MEAEEGMRLKRVAEFPFTQEVQCIYEGLVIIPATKFKQRSIARQNPESRPLINHACENRSRLLMT